MTTVEEITSRQLPPDVPVLQFPRRRRPLPRRTTSGLRGTEGFERLWDLLLAHPEPEQTVAVYLDLNHRVISLPGPVHLCDRNSARKIADQVTGTAIAVSAHGVLLGTNHPADDTELPNLRERGLTDAVSRLFVHTTWAHYKVDPRVDDPRALRLGDHFVFSAAHGRVFSFHFGQRMWGKSAEVVDLAAWRAARTEAPAEQLEPTETDAAGVPK